jgi:hypothetical protein
MSSSIPAWLIPVIGIIGSIVLAVFAYVLKLTADVAGVRRELEICNVSEMRATVDKLVYRQEIDDGHAAAGLHAPTHFERDDLVKKLVDGDLDEEGLERVIVLLREAKKKEGTGDKRFWAGQLLGRAETDLEYMRRRNG